MATSHLASRRGALVYLSVICQPVKLQIYAKVEIYSILILRIYLKRLVLAPNITNASLFQCIRAAIIEPAILGSTLLEHSSRPQQAEMPFRKFHPKIISSRPIPSQSQLTLLVRSPTNATTAWAECDFAIVRLGRGAATRSTLPLLFSACNLFVYRLQWTRPSIT